MSNRQPPKSVEPDIALLGNGWLKEYGLDYKLEQASLNSEIDKALLSYSSKEGGGGGNRPDAKLLLQDSQGSYYPILIEYKGHQNSLVKLDTDGHVENTNQHNKPHETNITKYAVNGAIHYANAILHHTFYADVIAIGMTGYRDHNNELQHEIGVYYVSKENLGIGQEVGKYSDFSFLKPEYFDDFIRRVRELSLTTEELQHLQEKREQEIGAQLVRLNNDIFREEKNISEEDRVYLVAATIMANLGIPNKVPPLRKEDLKGLEAKGERDGDIILNKISTFLGQKHLPEDKKTLITDTLRKTLTGDIINRVENGESQVKRIFSKIIDDIGIYYKIGLTTDFTGKLFNEMYSWLGFSKDKLNDVVLTPFYVARLLAQLAKVNKDSYVWDFATGSAGLLVAAMNIMLDDAKENISSPEELALKEAKIKAEQLLGLEILPEVYMLAVLNMIMMGDGSSNILNENSLTHYGGHYGFGEMKDKDFPADAFVLNPPYSAEGNGMVFVEKALGMMGKGYAAIIIQNSAGNGKAADINRRILQHSTLLASIKMPIDLFVGKSSVQTYIYVFKVAERHDPKQLVKFIDFSNDGYTRTARKKASNNLSNTDHALERYQEVVNLVHYGRQHLHYLTEADYHEGHIDPKSGADWNQSAPADTRPTLQDFKKTIADYLAWEVATLLHKEGNNPEEPGK